MTSTHTQAKTYTMCHKRKKTQKKRKKKEIIYEHAHLNAYRTETQKQKKRKDMSSITHTQTIDCQHNNKFFFHVYPPSQMFLLSIWTTIFSVYIEIIHHLEGSGVFFFFFFAK
jgi:hypothetical protein